MLHITDLRYTKNTEAGEQAGTFVMNEIMRVNEYGRLQTLSLKCEFTRTKGQPPTVRWGRLGETKCWDGEDVLTGPVKPPEYFLSIDLVNRFFIGEDKN